jgi:hypothetical protein
VVEWGCVGAMTAFGQLVAIGRVREKPRPMKLFVRWPSEGAHRLNPVIRFRLRLCNER